MNYKELNVMRYTDWMITTPIMLLVLCLVFGYNNKNCNECKLFLTYYANEFCNACVWICWRGWIIK